MREIKKETDALMKAAIWAAWDVKPERPQVITEQAGGNTRNVDVAGPGIPQVLDDPAQPFAFPAPGAQSTGNRRAFAEWLTRPGIRSARASS